jgi:hypothetical protein
MREKFNKIIVIQVTKSRKSQKSITTREASFEDKKGK